jgi:hypothetical protein
MRVRYYLLMAACLWVVAGNIGISVSKICWPNGDTSPAVLTLVLFSVIGMIAGLISLNGWVGFEDIAGERVPSISGMRMLASIGVCYTILNITVMPALVRTDVDFAWTSFFMAWSLSGAYCLFLYAEHIRKKIGRPALQVKLAL